MKTTNLTRNKTFQQFHSASFLQKELKILSENDFYLFSSNILYILNEFIANPNPIYSTFFGSKSGVKMAEKTKNTDFSDMKISKNLENKNKVVFKRNEKTLSGERVPLQVANQHVRTFLLINFLSFGLEI